MIDANLNWSKPKEVSTKYGPRILRKARPTEEFWTLWRGQKAELKAAGYGLSKDRDDQWEVTHWGKLEGAEVARREEEVDASRAVDVAGLDVSCPDGLAYLPFQRAGIAYAMSRRAVLIADEMGLGKTIQAIGVINATPDAKRILVVCPASLKLNWKRELERWSVVKRMIGVVDGSRPVLLNDAGVVVVNYDILHKHIEWLRSTAWDIAIVDEAHYCKTRGARRTKMLFGYKPTRRETAEGKVEQPPITAKRRLLLSGTPIANRPAELFPLIHYLDPAAWPNFFSYAKRYCAANRTRFGWDFSGSSNLAELQNKLRASVMVRRLKTEVLTELPRKRRQVIELPCPEGAETAVRNEREAYAARAARIAELQARVELAKATDDPQEHRAAVEALKAGVTAAFAEISRLRHETAIVKIPAVIEFVEDSIENSGKVVLFAHHKDVVAAIAKKFGDDAVTLVGDTKMADRQAAVDRFQNDPTCKLFIGSITAAGVGITLTAASHVVFAELDWVPGNVSQAEDRCHRIGQAQSVLVQHLVLEESLDANMAQTIIDKQEVIDKALDLNGKPVYESEPAFSARREEPATIDVKREQLDKLAAKLTPEQRQVAHRAVQVIAGMCNGAVSWDAAGFSKVDVSIGHSLAGQSSLSPRQCVLAAKLARKYRRQLPAEINEVIAGALA